jgi:hypothetical protein
MSSSMAGSVVNILFLFVVFLLLFRAFASFMHGKFGLASLNIFYVFILGFLFLGAGSYYINYVNITGFVEDDSKRLNSTAPSDSMHYEVNGESNNPPKASIITGKIDANTVKYRLDNIPHVYVIPAFMDEIAVSLATAAGLGRSGDYYTLAVMRDPNVVFTMTANQMLIDSVKGKSPVALCKFYQEFSNCFEEYNKFKMIRACQSLGNQNYSDVVTITKEECDNMIKQYGTYMQGFLDQTVRKYADKNDTYKAIYESYSQMAQQLQKSDFKAIPPPVKSKIEESLKNVLTTTEYVISKTDDEGEIARKLTDSWFGSNFIQYLGMVFKDIISSIGKSWLVQTLLVQNEIVIYLSFYLLPLVVLITFLTNNFKYLTEYAFGYLLLKLQLPLWVIGHYLATGHVFNNLLASPTINGFLIELVQSGEINNSDILVNTITAGITSLGVGALFLFGKSAAGGIQQGVAAGGEILRGAMEVIKTTAAVAGVAVGGAVGLAGAGALSRLGAVGESTMGAVGNALSNIAGANTVSGLITATSRGAGEILGAVRTSKLASMPIKMLDTITSKSGQFFTDEATGRLEKMRLSNPGAINDVMNRLKENGYKTKLKGNGDIFILTVRNEDGEIDYISKDGGRSFETDNQKGDKDYKQISISGDIFKDK